MKTIDLSRKIVKIYKKFLKKKDQYRLNYEEIKKINYKNLNISLLEFQTLIKNEVERKIKEKKIFETKNKKEKFVFDSLKIVTDNGEEITFYDERYHNNLEKIDNELFCDYNLFYQYIRYAITKKFEVNGEEIIRVDSYSFNELLYIRNIKNIIQYYGDESNVIIKQIKFDSSIKNQMIHKLLNKKI